MKWMTLLLIVLFAACNEKEKIAGDAQEIATTRDSVPPEKAAAPHYNGKEIRQRAF
jgi:hypothetical protein